MPSAAKVRLPSSEVFEAEEMEIAKVLLENAAHPNVADFAGQTPLHTAALQGYVEIAKMLLTKGADPNIANEKGKTPVQAALYRNDRNLQKVRTIYKRSLR